MKLVINNFGKILIAVVAVTLALTLLSTVLFPGLRSFVATVFPNETNYTEPAPEEDNVPVQINVGTEVTSDVIFSGISALSGVNENLISQLQDDYAKAINERKHVFIYKINGDTGNTLAEKIDSSQPGEWAVIYVLNDAKNTVSKKVLYTVV